MANNDSIYQPQILRIIWSGPSLRTDDVGYLVTFINKIFIFLCRPDRYLCLPHLPPYPSIDLPLHPGEQERDVETAAVPAAETRQPGQLVVEA